MNESKDDEVLGQKDTKYTKIYSKGVPVFDEDSMFKVHVPLLAEKYLLVDMIVDM